MKLIGIGGAMGSGKDEVAKVLQAEFGFMTMAVSDAIIDACHILFGTATLTERAWDPHATETFQVYYRHLLEPARKVWQDFGMKCREVFGENVWINCLARRIARRNVALKERYPRYEDQIAITGIRFENEAEWIHEQGGLLWKLERPSPDAEISTHVTERALDTFDGWDVVIPNDGTLEDLAASVRYFRGEPK